MAPSTLFFKMNRQEIIESLRKQGYRLKYIPKDSKDPKKLERKWGDGSTDEVIPDECNYAVIQEDNNTASSSAFAC